MIACVVLFVLLGAAFILAYAGPQAGEYLDWIRFGWLDKLID